MIISGERFVQVSKLRVVEEIVALQGPPDGPARSISPKRSDSCWKSSRPFDVNLNDMHKLPYLHLSNHYERIQKVSTITIGQTPP